MPLSFNEPSITDQLSQFIRKMRDFLLNNPSDDDYYKMLYGKIDELAIKIKTEGWSGYEHKNPHRTLNDFLNNNNIPELVIKYYSVPIWNRKLIRQTKTEKTIKSGKKFFEWIFDQIAKIKLFK